VVTGNATPHLRDGAQITRGSCGNLLPFHFNRNRIPDG
jgi:hypothetical protein